MRVGIVGSRTFPQLQLVEWFIRDLPAGVVVVSGGARGVDRAAEDYARARGLEVVTFLPDLEGCKERRDFTPRYYARNQKIADNADLIVAFTEKDYGGTWDTIRRARVAHVPVKIIKPSAFFPAAEEDPEAGGDAEGAMEVIERAKGAGPFQVKRAGLGSYALRRKCYISSEEWAEIVALKDADPERLADKMLPLFLKFFADNKRFGCIHALTTPPRSTRNLGKPHAMDILAARLAASLGVAHVTTFKPWTKTTRGRFAAKGQAEITLEAAALVGKVVWVLDDVTTTNYTLRTAVLGLQALEIHAHGLAYVVMG